MKWARSAAGRCGQVPEPPGRSVAVHPPAEHVPQNRPVGTVADSAFDRPGHGGRQRDQDDFAAFASHAQDAVAVLFAEVGDVRPAGFEDPQPEQAQQGDQGEVVRVGRQPGGGEQGLEL